MPFSAKLGLAFVAMDASPAVTVPALLLLVHAPELPLPEDVALYFHAMMPGAEAAWVMLSSIVMPLIVLFRNVFKVAESKTMLVA